MDGNSRGGDDTLTGADHSINLFYGDALNMQANARGGDDTLIGVDRAGNHLCARKPGGTTSNPARLPPSFGTTAIERAATPRSLQHRASSSRPPWARRLASACGVTRLGATDYAVEKAIVGSSATPIAISSPQARPRLARRSIDVAPEMTNRRNALQISYWGVRRDRSTVSRTSFLCRITKMILLSENPAWSIAFIVSAAICGRGLLALAFGVRKAIPRAKLP